MTGRPVMDATAGLWCSNAGHCRDRIVEAIQKQAERARFRADLPVRPSQGVRCGRAHRGNLAPGDLDLCLLLQFGLGGRRHGAEDRARLLNALKGKGSRTRLIGRERGYHGVGFGGISRRRHGHQPQVLRHLLAGVDHLPHTYDREKQAFTKGEPNWGAHLADELERLVALHDASTIAAVIVEPMAGSTGVLPPPGLSQAAARDLRQARHPAHLRRGDHRLRPSRHRLRRRALRRHPRHDHLRQGRHLGRHADGRRDGASSTSTTPS
jgi:beta-alanine--pyruvate transaminase